MLSMITGYKHGTIQVMNSNSNVMGLAVDTAGSTSAITYDWLKTQQ